MARTLRKTFGDKHRVFNASFSSLQNSRRTVSCVRGLGVICISQMFVKDAWTSTGMTKLRA